MEAYSRPLRVGLLLNDFVARAWIARIVEELRESEIAELSLAVVADPDLRFEEAVEPPRARGPYSRWVPFRLSILEALFRPQPAPAARRARPAYDYGGGLVGRLKGSRAAEAARRAVWRDPHEGFRRYQSWDLAQHHCEPDAFRPLDLRPLLAEVPLIVPTVKRTRYRDRFSLADIEAIRAHEPDVLLRFGFRILTGDVLDVAPCGVWSFHHGDNRHYRGGPALFWEIYEGQDVCGTILQRLSEKLDQGRVLYRSTSAVLRDSHFLTSNYAYWKSAAFVGRCLSRLHALGPEGFEAESEERFGCQGEGPLYRTPTNRQMLRFFAQQVGYSFAQTRERGRNGRQHWEILWRPRSAGAPSLWQSPDPEGFRALRPPPGRFWADPFLVEEAGETWLFCEEYSYASELGRIVALRLDAPDPEASARTVLEAPHHLSNPHVFRYQGQLYMTPEAAMSGGVELYRCVEFPDRWEHERTLLDVTARDPVIYADEEALWLFVEVREEGAAGSDELCAYRAESLHGPWTPHPLNPVVSDVTRARPGGRVQTQDGRLIRLGQDCSRGYGYALQVAEITTLRPDAYEERPLRALPPDLFGAAGLHAYDQCQGYEVVDVRRWLSPSDPVFGGTLE